MDEQKWRAIGSFVYKLAWNGNYYKGVPQFENALTVQVQEGFGTTDVDAAALAQQIADDLNTSESLISRCAVLEGALNKIACWDDKYGNKRLEEDPDDYSGFDYPAAVAIARSAISGEKEE